jgi:hypothetical protein
MLLWSFAYAATQNLTSCTISEQNMLRSKNVGILGRLVLRILIEDLGCENCRNWQNVAAPNRPADFILANYVVNTVHI